MLEVALEKAKLLKLNVKYTCKVPGVFDMPLVVETLLEKKNVDAVITLGAVIKGQTKHDEVIADVTITRFSPLSFPFPLSSPPLFFHAAHHEGSAPEPPRCLRMLGG